MTNNLTSQEYFKNHKHIYLSEVLSKDQCKDLCDHMHNLHKEGKLIQDDQCPLSWSVYGDPKFDSLLSSLSKPIGEKLGIELLPTYTYARLYQYGDVLKKHTDRPSCEISGTLTIGHDPDSKIWPIFVGKDENDAGRMYEIAVGDLVMYRGNEMLHWRPKYKGKWQVQIFFHYVDANGPHKEWANDKREALGSVPVLERMSKNDKDDTNVVSATMPFKYFNNPNSMTIMPQSGFLPGYCAFSSNFKKEIALTPEECDKIINTAKNDYATKASVGTSENSKQDLKIRNVDNYFVFLNDDTRWIYNKIMHAVSLANHEHFHYNISGITHELQLLHYRSDDGQGHYDWHVDVGDGSASCRKISMSIMLSPEDKYKGGNLEVNDHGVIKEASKEQGSIHMFPSYQLHRVTPVTEGERWVLVIWINGSDRFK
tara:strand:- start:49 stop:1329 length:1281 start_codon:yes stop_codon:yes gene_type:complete